MVTNDEHSRLRSKRPGPTACAGSRSCRESPASARPAWRLRSRRDAHEHGAVVLYGRCDEDRSISYQAWLDALGHLCLHAPIELLREHVEARGGELARLLPELAARVDLPARHDIDPETEQYLLFGAVVDLLGRVATAAPLVLVLDDLHWADRSSLLLLEVLRERRTTDDVTRVGDLPRQRSLDQCGAPGHARFALPRARR